MNGGVLPAMRLLADYVSSVVTSYASLGAEVNKAEEQLSNVASVDKASFDAMQAKYDELVRKSRKKEVAYETRVAELEDELKSLQESHAEVDDHLQQSRMEFSMYQSQSKAKLSETNQHKKILKKEVIELRKVVEDVGSENDAAQHEAERLRTDIETERQRNATLERYIERIEKQLSNQQNMCDNIMEIMSQTGSIKESSILGKVVGPAAGGNVDGRSGLPPSATASPSVDRSGRKNRLPRSFKSPTTQTARPGKLHNEDLTPTRREESPYRSGSLEADTEQGTEHLTSTTITLDSSAMNAPLVEEVATPRKATIRLDELIDDNDEIAHQNEGNSFERNANDGAIETEDEFNTERNLASNGVSRGSGKKSRKSRKSRGKHSKRDETVAKAPVDPPQAAPFTDADLYNEINNYEQSDQYIYDESGYDDDAKVCLATARCVPFICFYSYFVHFLTISLHLHFLCNQLKVPHVRYHGRSNVQAPL